MQTNLTSHVNQDARRVARKDFAADSNRGLNPEIYPVLCESRLTGIFSFNRGLIRIKRRIKRDHQLRCSFRAPIKFNLNRRVQF